MRERRVINEELIRFFETYYRRTDKPLVLLYEAPTGYGKTTIAPYHGYYARNSGISYGYIHILPMRSMVYKIYRDYTVGNKSKRKLLVKNCVENFINEDEICYQASGLTIFGKNPFLSCPWNFTTFDSYFLNLIRMGLGERNILARHYETSRAMIFTSTVTYDEAHLYGGDPGSPETTLFANFMLSLETSLYARSPINILSATLPTDLSKHLFEYIESYVRNLNMSFIWVRYGENIKTVPNDLNVEKNIQDKEYDSKVDEIKWKTNLYKVNKWDENISKIVNDISDRAHRGLKVLVVVNRPERAVKIYEELRNKCFEPVLIHGRLKYGERERNEEKIEETNLLIATQVVEAGIDVNYNVLFTDIAPPSNLIQRVGRINRYLESREDNEVNIIIDENAYRNIYVDDVIEVTGNFLEKYKDRINWRKPKCKDPYCKGYLDFLDEVYKATNCEKNMPSTHLTYLFLSQLPSIRWKDVLEEFLKVCNDKKGIVRSSLLIPLIHLENRDSTESKRLYENTIPANLTWILNNADKLFENEITAIFIQKPKDHEEQEFIHLKFQRNELEKKICKFLINKPDLENGRSDGEELLFIGLMVKDNAYRKGLGLLV